MECFEELNEGELFGIMVWGDGRMQCEAEKRNEYGDPDSVAGAGRVELGDENVGIFRGSGRTEGR